MSDEIIVQTHFYTYEPYQAFYPRFLPKNNCVFKKIFRKDEWGGQQ
ncbi:hypothetical protein BLGI_1237 [Brevibacillus laterosporus GI-9]|nr:hypothetical protein BLGI_1237 [Brevibacillus laterosporus GI-9]